MPMRCRTLMALIQLALGTISAATTIISILITVIVARQVSQIDNGSFQQFFISSTCANLTEKTEITHLGSSFL